MFSNQFYEERLSVREGNMKLLLETVTCITVIERSTNIPVTESTTSKLAKMQQTLSLT